MDCVFSVISKNLHQFPGPPIFSSFFSFFPFLLPFLLSFFHSFFLFLFFLKVLQFIVNISIYSQFWVSLGKRWHLDWDLFIYFWISNFFDTNFFWKIVLSPLSCSLTLSEWVVSTCWAYFWPLHSVPLICLFILSSKQYCWILKLYRKSWNNVVSFLQLCSFFCVRYSGSLTSPYRL